MKYLLYSLGHGTTLWFIVLHMNGLHNIHFFNSNIFTTHSLRVLKSISFISYYYYSSPTSKTSILLAILSIIWHVPVFYSPKCRHKYKQIECPTHSYCFCGKVCDPKFDPWLIPHSCGQTCGRGLKPSCGHSCLLNCHPGMIYKHCLLKLFQKNL